MIHGFFGFVFSVFLVGGLLVVLAIIGVAKALGGRGPKRRDPDQAQEAEMIQELYQGLTRLEDRIESLETILLDKERDTRHD